MRLILIMMILLQQSLMAAEVVGKILASEGSVSAKSVEGERTLSKDSDVLLLETIVVGAASRAQILFSDGALLNLIPNTEFRVNTYRYKVAAQTDQASSELLKGGMRLLSGSIAKKNPNEFDIKTPSATIGLRGTVVEVALDGTRLFVGVEFGRALVSNSAGSKMIGVGEKNQYIVVPGENLPPEFVLKRPDELKLSIFTPPPQGRSIDQVRQSQPSATLAPTNKGAAPAPSTTAPTTGEAPASGGTTTPKTSGGGASIQGGPC